MNTKSQRFARARFHSLRSELEQKFPMREPTADEKTELLQREIKESIVQHSFGGEKKPPIVLSPSTLSEVQTAVKAYYEVVETTSDLSQSSQATYIDMADRFVRWLHGEFNPGSREEPYRAKKIK